MVNNQGEVKLLNKGQRQSWDFVAGKGSVLRIILVGSVPDTRQMSGMITARVATTKKLGLGSRQG